MSDDLALTLTKDEALVLFEWLSEMDDGVLGPAEQAVIDGLVAMLETQLTAPFAPDHDEQVLAARARLSE